MVQLPATGPHLCSSFALSEWRYVTLATILQWVQLLILFFGPTLDWDVDWQGNRSAHAAMTGHELSGINLF